MKSFIALALVVVLASSTTIENTLTESDVKQYHKALHSRWGRIAVELAELNALAEGPVEDLRQAIVDLRNDARKQREWTEKDHAVKENYHVKKVQQLNGAIQSAQSDIIRLTTLLGNVLYPAKKNYENTIRTLKANIAHNLRVQAAETERSNQARAAFLAIQGEHKAAIADLDKCLRVVNGLTNPSLAQVSQIHILLRAVQGSLNSHEKYAPMINSILQITSQRNLKDIHAIRGCLKLLNSLRESIVNDLNEYTRIENLRIEAYKRRMAQLAEELRLFRKQLAENIQGLTETIARIKQSIIQRAQRTIDLRTARRDLKTELSNWTVETGIFNRNIQDLTEEINGAEDVIAFLNNANFGSYLRSQINSAGSKYRTPAKPKTRRL